MEGTKKYLISSEEFSSFEIAVKNGKVIWCSDKSHPRGTNFETLKEFYETRQYKCKVEELKEK